MCAVTSENEEFITYARCTSFRPAVFVSAKRFNKIRYDVLERFECGFFLDSSRTIDYPDLEERGMKVRPLRPAFPSSHSGRENLAKYILFEALKLVC